MSAIVSEPINIAYAVFPPFGFKEGDVMYGIDYDLWEIVRKKIDIVFVRQISRIIGKMPVWVSYHNK